jgi:hypothetical protein
MGRDAEQSLPGATGSIAVIKEPLNYGYKTEQVLPVDLFPQTYHIESIAVIHRQLYDG